MKKRFTIIVLDSVGIGALPDAGEYGDEGSNTLSNTARAVGGLELPNLASLGLTRLPGVDGVRGGGGAVAGAYGRMMIRSAGKDTTTGHWEMVGVILDKPFRTFPCGFPPEVIRAFTDRTGREVLGNEAASGTEIIARLGEEHLKTGKPIVYTSADSVFQIAAHEEVIPVEELYRMCRAAREIMTGDYLVGRVIARPFTGRPGSFVRTERRKDFGLEPPRPTALDLLSGRGVEVHGVGKIEDIYSGRGVTRSYHTADNAEGIRTLQDLLERVPEGVIFANLVDFDMRYGHRNDAVGFSRALEEFDRSLPSLTGKLTEGEFLVVTADHGCDPTTESTDHSREYVPLLVTAKGLGPVDLGTRETAGDLGKTLLDYFDVPSDLPGESFLDKLS